MKMKKWIAGTAMALAITFVFPLFSNAQGLNVMPQGHPQHDQAFSMKEMEVIKQRYIQDLAIIEDAELLYLQDQQELAEAIKNNTATKTWAKFETLNNIETSSSRLGTVGDILVAYNYRWGNLNVAFVGHAAIVSNNNARTVESFPKTGVQYFTNDWKAKSKVYGLWVKGATTTKYKNAASYAQNQIGKKYNWNFVNKFATDKFYCSQLVWRAWYNQGINVDYIKVDTIVTPMELAKSNNTTIFYHRG
ncbi:YiiX/YebB-like N1pC/P60 family cysteine hydrolase [Rubeoparvulum massiliense]|uniref:YiiX/YebB-like N1pC/P60 family cysteine hydrolase n=1 Tax=Rubeoparvulum massiliense TaxID=1631346 RepID=UPI00065DD13A|nr:YiiX/YebB-like N1pC/P60 family cysteine hydrolase [Rubeoparvulum massiliense]